MVGASFHTLLGTRRNPFLASSIYAVKPLLTEPVGAPSPNNPFHFVLPFSFREEAALFSRFTKGSMAAIDLLSQAKAVFDFLLVFLVS